MFSVPKSPQPRGCLGLTAGVTIMKRFVLLASTAGPVKLDSSRTGRPPAQDQTTVLIRRPLTLDVNKSVYILLSYVFSAAFFSAQLGLTERTPQATSPFICTTRSDYHYGIGTIDRPLLEN